MSSSMTPAAAELVALEQSPRHTCSMHAGRCIGVYIIYERKMNQLSAVESFLVTSGNKTNNQGPYLPGILALVRLRL